MTVDVEGKTQQLDWQLPAAESSADNSYLTQVVEAAQADEGLSLPALGTKGLAEMRRMFVDDAQGLARLGRVALASGDTAEAARLAKQALSIDAADEEAAAILRAPSAATKPATCRP